MNMPFFGLKFVKNCTYFEHSVTPHTAPQVKWGTFSESALLKVYDYLGLIITNLIVALQLMSEKVHFLIFQKFLIFGKGPEKKYPVSRKKWKVTCTLYSQITAIKFELKWAINHFKRIIFRFTTTKLKSSVWYI